MTDDGPALEHYGKHTFEELQAQLAFASNNMLSDELSLRDAGPWYEEFTDAMRAHALLWLLVDADPHTCFRDLTLSGQVRRHFLRRSQREKSVHCFNASSRIEPFFDAVAAESLDVARDIAALTPTTWLAKDEYEDDFCYARFLYGFLGSKTVGKPAADLAPLLDRFEGALDGAESPRLDLCRALVGRDQDEFDEAFDALVDERQEQVEERRAETNPVLLLDGQVFVEGLALLRIAKDIGLRTRTEYPGCPRLARTRSRVGELPDTLPPP